MHPGSRGLKSLPAFAAAHGPIAKWTVGKAFNRATATAAASFLDNMPFPVKAIPLNGRREFLAGFETSCQARAVAFYVLLPRSPEMNGAVEHDIGAWRYEFHEPTNSHQREKLDPHPR